MESHSDPVTNSQKNRKFSDNSAHNGAFSIQRKRARVLVEDPQAVSPVSTASCQVTVLVEKKKKKNNVKKGLVKGDPSWKGCQQWLAMKNRYCKFPPLPMLRFCGHHNICTTSSTVSHSAAQLSKSSVEGRLERVPCPLDPTHSVYKHRLAKHLKRCPKLKQNKISQAKSYYKKGVNKNLHDQSNSSIAPNSDVGIIKLKEGWTNNEMSFFAKIRKLYEHYVGEIKDSFCEVSDFHTKKG